MPNLPDLGSSLPEIAVRSAIIYSLVVLGLRLGGRREVGQLSVPDLVVLLIISNGVQNAMVGGNETVLGGLVSGATIIGLNHLIQRLARRKPQLRRVMRGQPRLLYSNGCVNEDALKQEEITPDELHAAFRAHGIMHRRDVRLAVLEVDGSISVIAKEDTTGAQGGQEHRRAGRIPRRTRHPVERRQRAVCQTPRRSQSEAGGSSSR